MNATEFQNLMQLFKFHDAFGDADVIVLYGSRVHLQAGYPARARSDLDMAIFYQNDFLKGLSDEGKFKAVTDRNDYATNALKMASQRLGFPILAQVPRVDTFENFLAEEKPFSFDQQIFALRLVDRLATEGNFTPDLYRELYHRIRSKNWYNPEAIFIFRTGHNLEARVRALRAIGYRNFYSLSQDFK